MRVLSAFKLRFCIGWMTKHPYSNDYNVVSDYQQQRKIYWKTFNLLENFPWKNRQILLSFRYFVFLETLDEFWLNLHLQPYLVPTTRTRYQIPTTPYRGGSRIWGKRGRRAANVFFQYIHCGILESSDWLAGLTSSHGYAQGLLTIQNYPYRLVTWI
jgi:hypothetical protein